MAIKVLMVGSEMVPYAATGGLGCSALCRRPA